VIHSLSVKNYASYKNLTEIEFFVGPKAGDRDIFLESSVKNRRVNAVTALYGANASGKSNLLKALSFLHMFIQNSASWFKPGDEIPIEQFAFSKKEEKDNNPTELGLDFEYKGILYRYELVITETRVLRESLYKKQHAFIYIFTREWNEANHAYTLKSRDELKLVTVAQRENASFISSAILQANEFALEISKCLNMCYDNMGYLGRTTQTEPLVDNIYDVSEAYNQSNSILSLATHLINKMDLGIHSIIIKERTLIHGGKEQKIRYPYAVHSVNGKEYLRPMFGESRGTQCLYVTLRYVLPVLLRGGVAVIDEFETGLHPHMVKAITDLFYSKITNPHGAQLIASFHSDYLLSDSLEKYQVVLVQKDPETLISEAWRLDKMRETPRPRTVDNIYAKYHAGAYGGVPNIDI
jgi:AAA15 family ATPase/GTPase